MTTPNSVPFPPDTWGIELPETFIKSDIESLLQNVMQALSECVSARSSDSISTYPYNTGAVLSSSSGTRQILQQYVTWTVPAGGGSTTIALSAGSSIVPIEIYGTAIGGSTPSIIAYPIGYSVGTVSFSAYFSNNSVNITASAALAAYTATVVVRYVYGS